MTRRARCLAVALALLVSGCSLGAIDLADERPLALRSTITAADGTMLARLYRENRELVSIDDIDPDVIDAVIAAEDERFFEHPGYDLKAIARAAIINATEGKILQGGSTITQQYVKNTFFRDPPKTLARKARELRFAIEVERLYSKDEILERYLNTVYLGQGAYGVKAAAETYFGRDTFSLSIQEAAMLAALIKAPARYDPRDHPKRGLARRNYVIDRMAELEMISDSEATVAKEARLGVIPDPPRFVTRQPYFVEAVRQEILRDPRLGKNPDERDDELWRGGLTIESTLVPRLQRAARRAVDSVLNQPGDPDAAVVAIRPSTGQIVAMVGGRDWGLSQVNLALGKIGGGSGRQPGSSFKPIVAAAALESGIPLDTRYEASPFTFTFDDGSTWSVRNSEGTAGGFLPLDEAMVRSVNGVYARLGLQLGPGQIATQAQLMGVRSDLPSGPAIALGSAQVSVVDMAAAFATLANYGTAIEPTTIRRITRANGEVLKPDQETIPSAVAPGNAYLLTKVLEQVLIRGTGTGARIGRPAAGKTGTTNLYVDAWFVGYTPDLVAAVWVGHPQGSIPMFSVHGIRVAGGTLPATIWRLFMLDALSNLPPRRFKVPKSDVVVVEIDPVTGLLAAPWCPGERQKMLRQLAPTQYCPLPVIVTPIGSPAATATPSQRPERQRDRSPEPRPTDEGSPEPSPSE